MIEFGPNATIATNQRSLTFMDLLQCCYDLEGSNSGEKYDNLLRQNPHWIKHFSFHQIIVWHKWQIHQRYQKQRDAYTEPMTYDEWVDEYMEATDWRSWKECDWLCETYPWWSHYYFNGEKESFTELIEKHCPVKQKPDPLNHFECQGAAEPPDKQKENES